MLQMKARKSFGLFVTAMGPGSLAWSPAIAGSRNPAAAVTLSMGPNEPAADSDLSTQAQ